MTWTALKIRIGEWTALPEEALHIHVGLALLIVAALILRRPPWHWLPWLAVLLVELVNEAYDLIQWFEATEEGNLPAAFHDFWLTMLWPTVILIVFPQFVRAPDVAAEEDQPPL